MTGKGAPRLIGDGDGNDDWYVLVERILKIGNSVKAGFKIERVKDCLGEKKIDPAFNERFGLLVVRFVKFVITGGTVFWTIDIR